MSAYWGVVKNNVVVLPQGVHLDDGLQVEVRPVQESRQASRETRFRQKLVRMGLLIEIKSPVPETARRCRTLIKTQGRPVSQMIIEERR